MKKTISLTILSVISCGYLLNAQVPRLVNYQGRVAVNSINYSGAGQFKFALVNSNGSTTFWSNDGTSAGGSEPAGAVTLTVTAGLYSVLLGDTVIGNMTPISASVFANSDLRLRVWFNDGVHGSQLLTPDQRLAPTGYLSDGAVTTAAIAPGAVTATSVAAGSLNGNNIANGSLNYSHFTVPSAPSPGQVLGFDGNSLAWQPGAASSVFQLNGTNGYYNGGNVGIGTNTPASKLEVRTVTHATGFMHSDGTTKVGSYIGPGQFGATGGWLGTFTNDPLHFFVNNGEPTMSINGTSVGIGTFTPEKQLHVRSPIGGVYGEAYIEGLNERAILSLGGYTGAVGVPPYVYTLESGVLGQKGLFGIYDREVAQVRLAIKQNGNIGIGTTTPETKMEVRTTSGNYGMMHSDGNIKVASYIGGSGSGATGGWLGTVSNHPLFFFVNGGQPVLTIGTDQTVSVPVLKITGGADLAEPFPMDEEVVEKGSVVVIDAEHPGRLKRSTKAYDRRVAGVISGANGVNPGIALHQEGTMEGDQNVALSGRVYVAADASNNPIEPGDLLTTSETPGHAMKALDPARSQGAILGKAMSSLGKGQKGNVLVLVTLQ